MSAGSRIDARGFGGGGDLGRGGGGGGGRDRAARLVVGAALGQAGGLAAEDHGGEPGVAQRGREVVGEVGEDGAQP